uniref:Secreted protein n=1 Tax=Onchocerca volvulus TaxID=6282 RepID=A0A8R1Y3J6_ONCVO
MTGLVRLMLLLLVAHIAAATDDDDDVDDGGGAMGPIECICLLGHFKYSRYLNSRAEEDSLIMAEFFISYEIRKFSS